MATTLSEYGFDPSCGCFGVLVKRTRSDFSSFQSMEVKYDEMIDYESTPHQFILPWFGAKVSPQYLEKNLLDRANVPSHIQHVSAINMILRVVDEIINDRQQQPELSSILVLISSDKDTADYSELSECFEDMELEDDDQEQG